MVVRRCHLCFTSVRSIRFTFRFRSKTLRSFELRRVERTIFQSNDGRLSVLEVIIQNNSPALINPILIALVEQKWKYFAHRILRRRFLLSFIYLIAFLTTTILEQMTFETVCSCLCSISSKLFQIQADENGETTFVSEKIRYYHRTLCLIGHLIVIFGALSKAAREITEMLNVGFRGYFGSSVRFVDVLLIFIVIRFSRVPSFSKIFSPFPFVSVFSSLEF